ncbi:hypothetical protein [Thalassobaculum sp.]|uniref:hypothetical protein n=1 Tax=Thalassobaculum sp. TaxID=2022740 RepID=UPI0032EB4BBD
MSVLSRSLAALALVAGVALAVPEPARADSFGFVITTDDDRGGHRGSRHRGHRDHGWRGDDRHWGHGHGRRHHRHGPPPWARGHRPYYGPYAHAYVQRCQVVWSEWHRNYVQVCR